MCNNIATPLVQSLCIDEDKLFTPYNIVTHKKVSRQIFSDHNSMLLKLSWTNNAEVKLSSPVLKDSHLGWKINNEGLTEFQNFTSDDQHIPNMYSEFEKYLNKVMDHCFQKRKPPPKTKEP